MKSSETVKPTTPMIDPFGRQITYLRVSVTDRCDFRCVYCMTENMTFLPKKDLLTLEEIDRLASAGLSSRFRAILATVSMSLRSRRTAASLSGTPMPLPIAA